ncbi:MAG: flagellar hook-basal body complex protein FliE [Oscillospiraceae bacterium]|nr:flagellar hook-basal body complex protein FliE [Oscillospiraceae bacterium]
MNSINAAGGYPAGIDGQYELIKQNIMPEEDTVRTKETFKDVIRDFLEPVNELEFQDKLSNAELMIGNADNLHSTMIAGQYAELSLKFALAVRNKVIDAYNEVMRMQI